MENKKYVYEPTENINISKERQEELIYKLQKKLGVKDRIALFKVTSLAENEEECAFLLEWLKKENVLIRGVNSTLENEIENYERIMRLGEHGDKGRGYKTPRMPKEEQTMLFEKLSRLTPDTPEYKETAKKIAEGALRLVDWTLYKFPYIREMKSSSFDEDDKRQWGCIGLTNAVKTFDPNKGYQFSTYAVACIIRKIAREWEVINEIPANIYSEIRKVERLRKDFFRDIGREPAIEEIADIFGVSEYRIEVLDGIKSRMNIDYGAQSDEEPMFLDGEEDGIEQVGDTIFREGDYYEREYIDNGLPYSEEREEDLDVLEGNAARNVIEKQLRTLTPRERRVLELRFGLYEGIPQTLEEVGNRFYITRERVRQIEAKALRKLRHPSRARHLKVFLDR